LSFSCPYFGGELIWGSSDYGNEQIMGPLRRRRTPKLTHYAKSHASENTHQWVATSWCHFGHAMKILSLSFVNFVTTKK
jgi:hypothetical protein